MKRNPILVLGLGVLLSFGVFAVGCGDDAAPKKNDGSADAKKDTGSTGGSTTATGGAKGTGGVTGAGGVTSTGGVTGAGGVIGTGGVITGSGGTTGAGGSTGPDGGALDTGRDVAPGETAKPDVPADKPIDNDTNAPADGGPVHLDTQGLDTTPVSLDTALDQAPDAPALDTAAIEVQIDSGVDSGID